MAGKWDSYHSDLVVAWTVRSIFLLSTVGILLTFGGCSTESDKSRSLDLSVKGSYIPGPDASTRNQTPQGGTDEKSDRTPIEPAR